MKKSDFVPGSGQPLRWDELEFLAWCLNQTRKSPPPPADFQAAWQDAETILGALTFLPAGPGPDGTTFLTRTPPFPTRAKGSMPGLAVKEFNRRARRTPVYLELVRQRARPGAAVETVPTIRVETAEAGMLRDLWRAVFLHRAGGRLKRCDRCLVWFVDRTDNTGRRWCGDDCKGLWWTRGRRRQQGGSHPKRALRKRGKRRHHQRGA